MQRLHEGIIQEQSKGQEMSLLEVGRLAVKIAGRDAGKTCVIIDKIEENLVLIDGQTRRRKCNVIHLELLPQTIKLKKGASHGEVASEFKKLGLEVLETKAKEKKEKPKKQGKEKLKAKKAERKKNLEEKKKGKEKKAKKEKKEEMSEFEEAVEKEAKAEDKK